MIGIWANVIAIIVGTLIGWLFKRRLSDKYIDALWQSLGLLALGVGIQTVVNNMNKSHYPLLFIFSLAIGIPLGTFFNLNDRATGWIDRHFQSHLGEGVATASFLDGIGALAILGPVTPATNGNQTMLYTNAMLTLVCGIIFGTSFGLGMILESPIIFIWFSFIYFVTKYLSASYFSNSLVVEMSVVGGFLVMAGGLSLLKIREFKTVDMLPSLLVPMIYFLFI
mgnify:FL=1